MLSALKRKKSPREAWPKTPRIEYPEDPLVQSYYARNPDVSRHSPCHHASNAHAYGRRASASSGSLKVAELDQKATLDDMLCWHSPYAAYMGYDQARMSTLTTYRSVPQSPLIRQSITRPCYISTCCLLAWLLDGAGAKAGASWADGPHLDAAALCRRRTTW